MLHKMSCLEKKQIMKNVNFLDFYITKFYMISTYYVTDYRKIKKKILID